MVKGRLQAMDSLQVKAIASMDILREKQIIEDTDAFAVELAEDTEEGE
ncbi:hypothetical protein [Flavisolibacter nicotianae]|nr:hypothetical protein [Flavisolibacter nicotianae]